MSDLIERMARAYWDDGPDSADGMYAAARVMLEAMREWADGKIDRNAFEPHEVAVANKWANIKNGVADFAKEKLSVEGFINDLDLVFQVLEGVPMPSNIRELLPSIKAAARKGIEAERQLLADWNAPAHAFPTPEDRGETQTGEVGKRKHAMWKPRPSKPLPADEVDGVRIDCQRYGRSMTEADIGDVQTILRKVDPLLQTLKRERDRLQERYVKVAVQHGGALADNERLRDALAYCLSAHPTRVKE